MAQFLVILFACGLIFSPWTTLGKRTEKELKFDYDSHSPYGPDYWGSLSPEWQLCQTGKRQSPIEIIIPNTIVNTSLGKLAFKPKASQGVLINSGHSVDVALGPKAGRLTIDGKVYELQQFHFHAPSEHLIQHTRFPLELHLVHKTADGKIAVISLAFKLGKDSKFLSQFQKHLGDVTNKGSKTSIGFVSFNDLHLGVAYARYQGSLTTPPCSEGVTWSVLLSQKNTVSQAQLDALEKVLKEPNARPIKRGHKGHTARQVERFPARHKGPLSEPQILHT